MVAQLTEYSKLLHHSSPSKLCEWRYMTCTIPRKRAPEEADMPTSNYWPSAPTAVVAQLTEFSNLLSHSSPSCGLPRRFTTPPALTGINAAKERSRLFPFEGRAGMWCSPVPAPSTDTRADPASARRAAGPARGRVGRAGGPLWCGPSLGAGAFYRRNSEPRCSLECQATLSE